MMSQHLMESRHRLVPALRPVGSQRLGQRRRGGLCCCAVSLALGRDQLVICAWAALAFDPNEIDLARFEWHHGCPPGRFGDLICVPYCLVHAFPGARLGSRCRRCGVRQVQVGTNVPTTRRPAVEPMRVKNTGRSGSATGRLSSLLSDGKSCQAGGCARAPDPRPVHRTRP